MMSQGSESRPPTFIEGWTDEASLKFGYHRLGKTNMWVTRLSLGGAHVSGQIVFNHYNTEVVSGYEDVVQSIRTTIKSGINYIDTSPLYGQGRAEVVLGKALEAVPRQAFYLATKVGRKGDCTFDYRSDAVIKSVESSLKKLKVEYLDVVQVHDVEFANIDLLIEETLPTLAKLKQSRIVRHIGVTGYPLDALKEVVERSKTPIDVVVSYCRVCPFDQSLLGYVDLFKKQHRLGLINAAVLGMGLLTDRPTLPYWHPATDSIADACRQAAQHCRNNDVDICKLSVHFALQIEAIDTHLIGMETEEALKTNLDVMLNGISDKEERVLHEIIANIFSGLQVNHWEGVELRRYREDPEEFSRFLREGPR